MALVPATPAAATMARAPISGHVYVDVYEFGSYLYTTTPKGIDVRSYAGSASCAGSTISPCPPTGAGASTVTRLRGAYRIAASHAARSYIWAGLRDGCSTGFIHWFTGDALSRPHTRTDLHIHVDREHAC